MSNEQTVCFVLSELNFFEVKNDKTEKKSSALLKICVQFIHVCRKCQQRYCVPFFLNKLRKIGPKII
jgi:hypothetical protein